MTNAIITQTNCPPPMTSASFIAAVETACINAGLGVLIDSFSDANGIYRVFELVLNSSATKGKIYFLIQLKIAGGNINALFSTIYETWNTATHAGTNGSATYAIGNSSDVYSFTNGQTINLYSINHPELKVIYIQQNGSISHSYGIHRPASKPDWWNENLYPYAFMHTSGAGLTGWNGLGSAMNPINNAASGVYVFWTSTSIANPNGANSNKRNIYNEIYLLPPSSVPVGDVGKTSADACQVASSGMSFLDIVEISSTEQYTLITPGGSPGIGIRTV